jgi:hypothetical protein
MAASVGLAEPDEMVSAAELVDRFDRNRLPQEPTAYTDP